MVKSFVKGFVFLLLTVFLIYTISATFAIGKPGFSIEKNYGPESNITGWMNVSFTNQQINSTIQTSLGQSIRLIDLLNDKLNKNSFVYTCNPATCTSAYSSSNGEETKTYSLTGNGSVTFAFVLEGKSISEIANFGVDIKSNNPESEINPLSIDILNDGQTDWKVYNDSTNFGEEDSGCYKGVIGETSVATIASDQAHQYCERIELTETPKTEIGAYITGTGAAEFTMSIKGVNEGTAKTCITTATGSGLQRIACSPTYQVAGGDYFVCIRKNNGANYQIAYETKNACGFTGSYNYQYDNDFNIFARQAKFASSVNITLNNAELVNSGSHTSNIERDMNDYITNAYRNNCTNKCVIPITINYNIGQNVEVLNAHMNYYSSGVLITETISNLYDVQEVPVQISAKAQKIILDNSGFKTPSAVGDYVFSVLLNNQNIFSENITVGKIPVLQSLNPTITAVKYPTKFAVKVSSEKPIVKYSWEFGDGKKQDTTINEITYTYAEAGTYTMAVTVVDKDGKTATRYFDVEIAPASEITPSLLEEASVNVEIVKAQIAALSGFEKDSVNAVLKIEEAENKINQLKTEIESAEEEADYEKILGELLKIKMPSLIAETVATNDIDFYPQTDSINLDALAEITRDYYDPGKEDLYKQSILSWSETNIETKMVYNEVTATYGIFEEPLLKVFSLHVSNNGFDNAYLVMRNMENLRFKEDYGAEDLEGYKYIELGAENDIIFSTTEDVDFTNLPVFFSPGINELTLVDISAAEKGTNKWILFTIIVGIILFVALIMWAVLQWWYKVRYETYLFKNRNNLYNLVNFIANEKKKGTKDGEIAAKLRKAGWNPEQLRYAIKKYENKNTGMFEIISFDRLFKNFKNQTPTEIPKEK